MSWRITGSVEEFLGAAGEFLHAERARNTVALTVAESARLRPGGYPAGAAPVFGWWQPRGGPVTGAFLRTPPYPALLTSMSADAAVALAGELAGQPMPGINAEPGVAAAFAPAWRARTGAGSREFRRMRLFRLGQLTWPDPVPPGSARLATVDDTGLIVAWFKAFATEVEEIGEHDHGAAALERLSSGGLTLWEYDGATVSLAGLTRMVAGMVRVGPVYTPPERRGRGYAGAVTSAVSQQARDNGAADVLLYTDLANPTSNALYQRLGYLPVEDRVMLTFE